MIQTELKIYSLDKYYNIDLYENEAITLNKSIINVQEPEQRTSDYTKTIKIPGTHNNNIIFSNIFNIDKAILNSTNQNFYIDFNPNLKADCILIDDGVPQLRGYLQLSNIVIIDENRIDYNIIIVGRTANIFQDLGDQLINQLDLSAYDHTWNRTNIVNSWSAPLGTGYVYPLIDYGTSLNGEEKIYDISNFYPGTYIKTLVDRLFKEAGYSYTSNFFNSENWKRLVMPFSGGPYKAISSVVNNRLFEASLNSTTTYADAQLYYQFINFDKLNKDTTPPGLFVPSTGYFTIPTGMGGNYTFRAELNGKIRYNYIYTAPNADTFITARIMKVGSTIPVATVNQYLYLGNITYLQEIPFSVTVQSDNTFFSENDVFYVEWLLWGGIVVSNFTWAFSVNFDTTSAFFNASDGMYFEDNPVSLNGSLPSDLKQADLLKGLIKMFNLYIEPDQFNDRNLIIEPRDDYYNSTVIDLSTNLDVSRDFTIYPMGALDFKTLEFHYLTDEDKYNKLYQGGSYYEYGYRKLTVNNDFLTETKKIELPFAATPLVDSSTNDRVISKIQFLDSNNDVVKDQVAKPRILFYRGLVNTGGNTFYLNSAKNGTSVSYFQFPYIGHVDSVSNPQFDLSFAVPRQMYYGGGKPPKVTDGNLYNLYWKKTINEITDKDSKIIECYMKFNSVELQRLSFRNLYKIDNQYYRLYQLEKDLNSNETAKCRFLKLKYYPGHTTSQTTANGGGGTFGSNEILPTLTYIKQQNDYIQGDKFKTSIEITPGGTADYYLNTKSQFVKSNTNTFLPEPSLGYDGESGKAMEMWIYNNGTSGIAVKDDISGYSSALNPGEGSFFISDGNEWVKIGVGVSGTSGSSGTSLTPGTLHKTEVSSNYNITTSDYWIISTSGSNTLTLPSAVGISGRAFEISNMSGSDSIIIDTTGGESIGGGSTYSVGAYVSIIVRSTDTSWSIISKS